MDWESRYQNNEIPRERGEAAPPLVEYLQNHTLAGRILVPGCGLGHDARLLAAHGSDTLGIDISPSAIEQAKAYPMPSKGNLQYYACDFLDPDCKLPASHFDYVFEHTCFCAIDPSQRTQYVQATKRLLKPGGHLLAILFTDMENDDGPPYPSTKHEIEKLFSPHFETLELWQPNRTFPNRENEESMYLMRSKG